MENGGGVSLLRTRRFESFFDGVVSSKIRRKEAKDGKKEEEIMKKAKSEAISGGIVDEEGWLLVAISWVKIVVCFVTMMMTTLIWVMIMLLLLPWPCERIKQGNIWGHVTGWLMMKILGNPIKIEGAEFAKTRAIYISNHASPIDIFLTMWLIPTGTVGIAKKEIIFYPLFGQLYVLANHLRIDRSNPTAAIESLKEGFVHMAIQTRLPIVPMVLTGTHLAWRKGSLHVRPMPISVKYLPPIKTNEWTTDKVEEYVKLVHDIYAKNLPESQRPLAGGNNPKKCS
ncbi:Phospholipid/glycerol acyltransferase [Dillenia turbinata]|uniref:Phospholipid/glycerol acyltransferase n=1 Tax=Dillenia turbinata TaxID=194707 RepID=A0AAN8WDT2_9MAGN